MLSKAPGGVELHNLNRKHLSLDDFVGYDQIIDYKFVQMLVLLTHCNSSQHVLFGNPKCSI